MGAGRGITRTMSAYGIGNVESLLQVIVQLKDKRSNRLYSYNLTGASMDNITYLYKVRYVSLGLKLIKAHQFGMKQEQQNVVYLTDRARFGPIIWQAPDMNNDCIIFVDWK